MLKKLFILIVFFYCSSSCNDKQERPKTAMDTARLFIRSSLDGEFNKAKSLLCNDTENAQFFNAYELYYQKLSDDKKNHYKSADYQINKYNEISDSVITVNYTNDYMNKPMDLKLIRKNGEWCIDFKYSYTENNSYSK